MSWTSRDTNERSHRVRRGRLDTEHRSQEDNTFLGVHMHSVVVRAAWGLGVAGLTAMAGWFVVKKKPAIIATAADIGRSAIDAANNAGSAAADAASLAAAAAGQVASNIAAGAAEVTRSTREAAVGLRGRLLEVLPLVGPPKPSPEELRRLKRKQQIDTTLRWIGISTLMALAIAAIAVGIHLINRL
jgi:hypothetical protein